MAKKKTARKTKKKTVRRKARKTAKRKVTKRKTVKQKTARKKLPESELLSEAEKRRDDPTQDNLTMPKAGARGYEVSQC